MDASEVDRIGVSEVVKEMACHSRDAGEWLKKFKKAHPAVFLNSASGTRTVKAKSYDEIPADEEEQFYQLLKQWRLEYPEPPKRAQFPKGRTQHDMDPDSD